MDSGFFAGPQEHLEAELPRLDLLLHREILYLRAAYQLSLDEFRGLYVTDEQVDSLVGGPSGAPGDVSTLRWHTEQAEALRRANREREGPDLPLSRVAAEFGLTDPERDLLLVALAPEFDLKYETIYAYLNNDVTRRWPTRDLALRLISPSREERHRLRELLTPEAPLFRSGLLVPIAPAPDRPLWLTGGFSLAPAASHFLLGLPWHEPELAQAVSLRTPTAGWDDVPVAPGCRGELQRITSALREAAATGEDLAPVLVLEGRPGSGRETVAEAACRDEGRPLLVLDLEALRSSGEPPLEAARKVVLRKRLLGAGLLVRRGEQLLDSSGRPLPEARLLIEALARGRGPLILSCEPGSSWRGLVQGLPALSFAFEEPNHAQRCQHWVAALKHSGCHASEAVVRDLANRFSLTPGQIEGAVADARLRLVACGTAEPRLLADLLVEAARGQSDQNLGGLAVKVSLPYNWDDLVLPPSTLRRVQEIASAIRYRHVVYFQWGFERRAATGKGLKVLFAGASGTGKTMTASVLARDLGLDLYKVDLSGVVSKFIGETEKNLEAIFRAAHCSNAILFFDEADALFGKRSEVKDAHDRYANLELAYLLQRMESYDGAVILASNLSRNIDEAFSRRMHYVLEFPMPDEQHRERLWHQMFPPEVPLGADVDCGFLAKQFPIAGGDIRNVALDAAFLAAQDGQIITMAELIRAMARQLMKQGKIPSTADFKQYHALIAQGE
jgi:hypothetical protein